MIRLATCVCLVLACSLAWGDAVVVTRAMKATTIAEIYVDPVGVRVELEIGLGDLKGFHNLLPDELRKKLGESPQPVEERWRRFTREDWVLKADGEILEPRIEQIETRRRIPRDEITGEPLETEGAEGVLFVVLQYDWPGSPARTLSIRPPKDPQTGTVAAEVGFVTYHEGLPINDFRYLGVEETLDLDWTDPWYSRFRNRNLWRRYDAPLSVFLYVDHFEVRKEVIARPKDLQQWVDLGLAGRQVIPVAMQGELKQKVADFLAPRGRVVIDGKSIEPELDRIHFVRRSLKQTGVIDPPEDLPVISATLGVIFVYPIEALPKLVTLKWDLFGERIRQVPAVATDEAGGMPSLLTVEDPRLRWQNFLTKPSQPGLTLVPRPPAMTRPFPVMTVLCGILALLLIFRWQDARTLALVLALLVAAVLLRPGARPVSIEPAEATEVVKALLTNVYKAFDRRGESVIYDTLADSAHGDLLKDIYLEMRKSLELRNQGGARVKVKSVEVLKSEKTDLEEEMGFRSRCTWNVTGSVGHWGHIHERRNQYEADFTVRSVGGIWKITELELKNEKRL